MGAYQKRIAHGKQIKKKETRKRGLHQQELVMETSMEAKEETINVVDTVEDRSAGKNVLKGLHSIGFIDEKS